MKSEQWKVRFGAPVLTTDGSIGSVHGLQFWLDERRITALEVHGGIFWKTQQHVPMAAVACATEELIQLKVKSAELVSHPPPHLAEDRTPRLGSQPPGGPRARLAVLQADQGVSGNDGPVGSVDMVILDSDTQQVHTLVIQQKDRRVTVPVAWITDLTAGSLSLNAANSIIAQQPTYHSDREVEVLLNAIPWHDGVIRALLRGETVLQMNVDDGIVTIRGHVRNSTQDQEVERLVQAVPGVRGITNDLVRDDTLELTVAQALWDEPNLKESRISVRSRFGSISLSGDVPTASMRAKAEAVAGLAAGSDAIVNHITIKG